MKILFITDDRSTYLGGNYYGAYVAGFRAQHEVITTDLRGRAPDLAGIELIIIGHGGQDLLLQGRTWRNILRRRLCKERYLRMITEARVPRVLLSKNDYKWLREKREIAERLKVDLLITHSKSALGELSSDHYRAAWLPFGIDRGAFRNLGIARPYVVGFRANSNKEWNDGVRDAFFGELSAALVGSYPVSLTMSQNTEGFLLGERYVEWLNQCQLLANTVSAVGTVGPRFLESIACGCVPLAPKHEYEGLLVPDRHYIAAATREEITAGVKRFLSDDVFRDRLHRAGEELLAEHTVGRHVERIMAML